ncbi:MAG: hypothetical protein WC522_01920 [Candidatus Omnitrophota bacterium]
MNKRWFIISAGIALSLTGIVLFVFAQGGAKLPADIAYTGSVAAKPLVVETNQADGEVANLVVRGLAVDKARGFDDTDRFASKKPEAINKNSPETQGTGNIEKKAVSEFSPAAGETVVALSGTGAAVDDSSSSTAAATATLTTKSASARSAVNTIDEQSSPRLPLTELDYQTGDDGNAEFDVNTPALPELPGE